MCGGVSLSSDSLRAPLSFQSTCGKELSCSRCNPLPGLWRGFSSLGGWERASPALNVYRSPRTRYKGNSHHLSQLGQGGKEIWSFFSASESWCAASSQWTLVPSEVLLRLP